MTPSLATNSRSIAMIALMSVSLNTMGSEAVSRDDPLEGMNRAVYKFNDVIDTYALRPVAQGYDYITPKPVQNLVSNFFSNLGEVRNAANAALQLRGKDTFTSLSRLAINSTVGMLGLVDVATPVGIEKQHNDFGITLARWGVPSGPYLVLPLFGPSTVRATAGLYPDHMADPVTHYNPESDRWYFTGTNAISTRAQFLGAEDLVVGDEYTFIRDTYLQNREFIITGQQPEDEF